MTSRRILCSLILAASLTSGCCRHRGYGRMWGGADPYGPRGLAGARGYGACVEGDDLYMLPPERMTREEARELRQWYRELNYNGRYRNVTRMRGRGGMPGAYGFDMGGMGGCCDSCGYGGMCEGEIGCPTYGDQMGGMSEGMMYSDGMLQGAAMGHTGHSACPVCGHQGPVQQLAPQQMVPHDPGVPMENGAGPSAPPSAPPMEPEPTEAAPANPPSAQLQQMLFAPPLQAPQ